jgi:hypothetical protein
MPNARQAYLISLKETYSLNIAYTKDRLVTLLDIPENKSFRAFYQARLDRLSKRYKELEAEAETNGSKVGTIPLGAADCGTKHIEIPSTMRPRYMAELESRMQYLAGFRYQQDTPKTRHDMMMASEAVRNYVQNELSRMGRDYGVTVGAMPIGTFGENPWAANENFSGFSGACGVSVEPGLTYEEQRRMAMAKSMSEENRAWLGMPNPGVVVHLDPRSRRKNGHASNASPLGSLGLSIDESNW